MHREAKGPWDVKFPYLDDLDIVYGRDRATGVVAEGFADAVHNMEKEVEEVAAQIDLTNDNNGDDDDEANSVTQTASTSTRNSSKKQKKASPTIGNPSKKMKSTSTQPTIDVQFRQLTGQFGSFMEGIATNFTTMAAVMANEDKREQLAVDRSNNLPTELVNLGLPSGDVYKAGNIIGADATKLNMFFNLLADMRRQYVINLLYPSSNF